MPSPIHGLYAITDHELKDDKLLFENVESALKGGLKILQLREKNSTQEQQRKRAQALKSLCRDYGCFFLINDNIELCKAVDADGVHLGQSDHSLKAARDYLGNNYCLGISCHSSVELAVEAQQNTADYIALGRFFPSNTKPDAPRASIECITKVKAQCQLPLVAIGGITLDNAEQLTRQGVHSVAVIHDLWSNGNIKQHVQAFQTLFQS